MTSNIGVRDLKDFGAGIGFATQSKKDSMDEIMKFMSKNREVLIPARLSKNMELVALFPEHTISK